MARLRSKGRAAVGGALGRPVNQCHGCRDAGQGPILIEDMHSPVSLIDKDLPQETPRLHPTFNASGFPSYDSQTHPVVQVLVRPLQEG